MWNWKWNDLPGNIELESYDMYSNSSIVLIMTEISTGHLVDFLTNQGLPDINAFFSVFIKSQKLFCSELILQFFNFLVFLALLCFSFDALKNCLVVSVLQNPYT
jgi:hypothetical protein